MKTAFHSSLVIALIALVIRLDSRGPAFFLQERVGLRGRLFTMVKFRTMVEDAESNGDTQGTGDVR